MMTTKSCLYPCAHMTVVCSGDEAYIMCTASGSPELIFDPDAGECRAFAYASTRFGGDA